jgi:hypothetical protein
MITVKARMEDNLWSRRSMKPEDVYQAMPVIMHKINDKSHYFLGLQHKNNPNQRTPLKDCWNTDENIYTDEGIENLFRFLESFAFNWCVAKLNSMK